MKESIDPLPCVHMRDVKLQTLDERAQFQAAASEVLAWFFILACIGFGIGCYVGWLRG